MEIKAKINKWDLLKLKSFLHCKGNNKQNEKTTHRLGEKIANDVTYNGLVSKFYKQLMMLKSMKTNHLVKESGKKT